jgi:hypothetical protein
MSRIWYNDLKFDSTVYISNKKFVAVVVFFFFFFFFSHKYSKLNTVCSNSLTRA